MSLFLKLFLLASLIWLSGCATSTTGADLPRGARLIEVGRNDGFRPNETLITRQSTLNPNQILLERIGTDPKTSRKYSYGGSSLSASVEITGVTLYATPQTPISTSFIATCNSDILTDAKSCEVNIGLYALLIKTTPSGQIFNACVGGHDFPGRTARVRVDGNQPLTTSTNGCMGAEKARLLASQLRSGNILIVQPVKWPYDAHQSSTFKLEGGYQLIDELFKFALTSRSPAMFR